MKYIIAAALAGAFAILDANGAGPKVDGVRVVTTQGAAVCTRIGRHAASTCFTHGRGGKGLPAWSRDGERIAFVESTPPDQRRLARLWIVDRHGQVIHSLPIGELQPNEVWGGMRFVEKLEWIGSSKVVASGSLNPSQSEYIVFDAASGRVDEWFGGDASVAVFHPRTGAATYFVDAPHFSRASDRATKLVVGGHKVLDLWTFGVGVAGTPVWSADGQYLAIPVESTDEAEAAAAAKAGASRVRPSLLIFNRNNRKATALALPPGAPAQFSIFWDRDTIIIGDDLESAPKPVQPATPGRAAIVHEAWQISLADATSARPGAWRRIKAESVVAPEVQAARAKSALRKELRAAEPASDLDVWCGACVVPAPKR